MFHVTPRRFCTVPTPSHSILRGSVSTSTSASWSRRAAAGSIVLNMSNYMYAGPYGL